MPEKTESRQNFQPSLRALLTVSVFVLLTGGAFLLNLLLPSPDTLVSERRKPAAFPQFSAASLMSHEFMDGFNKYAADNFVFRDGLRTTRAVSVFDVFRQTDKTGLYFDDLVGAGKFEKVNESSIRKAAAKINKLSGFLPGLDLYYSFIPDKSVYARRFFPGFDPEPLRQILTAELGDMQFIDLSEVLTANDYYRTDLHWDQARLGGVLDTLGSAMGFSGRLDKDFATRNAGTFNGVYTGQLALPQPPDTLFYLTSPALDKATVSYFEAMTLEWVPGPMYDLEAAGGRDPYDIFLSGTKALITIENPAADTKRQLYLFRDSFSSSLAPLLTSAYARITIIDMRYIDSRILENYVTFAESDADVLFLYSSQVLNNADILMVN